MRACKMFYFFFSSRRRHTRWNCDWSSDVCSSDLGLTGLRGRPQGASASGGSFAGKAALDGAAGPAEVARIGVQVEVPVCRQQRALQLEGQLLRVAAGGELS